MDSRNSRSLYALSVDRIVQDILFDPQTSGGLLIGVEKDSAGGLVAELREKGIPEAAIIGEVIAEPKRRIEIH